MDEAIVVVPSSSTPTVEESIDVVGAFAAEEQEEEKIEAIRCVCSSEEDDGFTIQCEECYVWQHARCVGISKENVPEQYFCEVCRPDWHRDGSSPEKSVSIGAANRRLKRQSKEQSMASFGSILENIVSKEALGFLEGLASNYATMLKQTPLRKGLNSYRNCNFEYCDHMIALPNEESLHECFKLVESREVKGRATGKKNNGKVYGLYMAEDADPGSIICCVLGHIQVANQIKSKAEGPSQCFVLFLPKAMDLPLAVDARRFGNITRFVRRSCRPNCELCLVLCGSRIGDVRICLFAKNTVKGGEEVFLPFDAAELASPFRSECACGVAEFCLAPLSVMSSPTQAKPAQPKQSESARAIKPVDRKLSREERKLQQYIEYFEKMENAEKKHNKRSGSAASSSGTNSASPTSSPQKASARTSPVAAVPRKKLWIRNYEPKEPPISTESLPETPSKKKVSLSDYLRKKKQNPAAAAKDEGIDQTESAAAKVEEPIIFKSVDEVFVQKRSWTPEPIRHTGDNNRNSPPSYSPAERSQSYRDSPKRNRRDEHDDWHYDSQGYNYRRDSRSSLFYRPEYHHHRHSMNQQYPGNTYAQQSSLSSFENRDLDRHDDKSYHSHQRRSYH